MPYVTTHPRKVRGEAVHQPKSEKIAEMREKDNVEMEFGQDRGLRKFEGANGRQSNIVREAVEATYLVPEMDSFVQASEVEDIGGRIKLWLDVGYPVHLIGPTGCGKTSLAMHIAGQLGRPVVWINGDESVTTTDLVGGYSQVETEGLRDKYVHNVFKTKDILKADWVDNPLTLACKYGYTLVYNEFARTKPAANNVLLSVFEEGILELPTKFGEDRYVKVHPDFNAILTSNSIEYAGIHKPQDALLDRMVGIFMDYYGFDTEVQIVQGHTDISKSEAERIVTVVRSLRDKLPDAQKPGIRACIMVAQGMVALNGSGNFEQLFIDVVATKTSTILELMEKKKLVKEAISESSW
jgi:nitric oxide reductase NorQ protein